MEGIIVGVVLLLVYAVYKKIKGVDTPDPSKTEHSLIRRFPVLINGLLYHFPNGKISHNRIDFVNIEIPEKKATMSFRIFFDNYNLDIEWVYPVLKRMPKKWKYKNTYDQEVILAEITNYVEWELNIIHTSESEKDALDKVSKNAFRFKVIDPKKIWRTAIDDSFSNYEQMIVRSCFHHQNINPFQFQFNLRELTNGIVYNEFRNLSLNPDIPKLNMKYKVSKISTSLKYLKKDIPLLIYNKVPIWFIAAFPDVISYKLTQNQSKFLEEISILNQNEANNYGLESFENFIHEYKLCSEDYSGQFECGVSN